MKIAFLLTTADSNAGTEYAIQSQIRSLNQQGHQTAVYSLYKTDGSMHERFNAETEVTYWVDGNGNDLTGIFEASEAQELTSSASLLIQKECDDQFTRLAELVAQEALKNIHADVVVTTTPALAFLASLFLPKNTVLVAQEHRASMRRGEGIQPLRAVAHDLDAIVSLNRENEEWITDEFRNCGFVSAVIPNALDEIFRPQSDLNSKTIIAAGRLAPGKQFNHLIQAFAIFHEQHPDWKLCLYGNGPQESVLRELVGRRNLNHAVTLTTDLNDLTMEWQNASIHAMTSRAEGQPLVILEASAAGVPTVAYDCPIGPRNIITHGTDGLLVPLNDTQMFADSLSELADSIELRESMGRNALKTAEAYSPRLVADLWTSLYTGLLERRQGTESRSETNRRFMKATTKLVDENSIETSSHVPIIKSTNSASYQVPLVGADQLSVSSVQSNNLRIAKELLDRAGISFVEVPSYGYFRHSLAVKFEDRDSLVEILASSSSESLCVRLLKGNKVISSNDWHPSMGDAIPSLADAANGFRLFVPESELLRRFTWGSAFAVDIELWMHDEERQGWLPPRHNPGLDFLTGKDFSLGTELFRTPLWDDIDFPIDVVYTWVDDTDQEWLAEKAQHSPAGTKNQDLSSGEMRFRNRDELRYSIRSVRTFMPWVRNIFVVTADQYPKWLSEESDIRVVMHRDIFPDMGSLPVFNSHAIESCLHRIPELSEHFLYFNDDTLLLRMQVPATYFQPNGVAKFFLSPVKIDRRPKEDVEPHMWAAQNNRRILEERFGKTITRGMLHTPHPHRKSTLERIESSYPDVMKAVRMTKFRSELDISLLSSFAQYFGYFSGSYTPGTVRYAYCSLGNEHLRQRLSDLVATEGYDMVTFGEAEHSSLSPDEIDSMLDQFFRARFPYPSVDEKKIV